MTHLTDEQLNALHDGALASTELATAEAHVVTCERCRAALAELAALDASLDAALECQPGDAYFADFARRVEARISSEAAASADPAPAAVRPVRETTVARRAWWSFTPRAFGFAGAAAALVVTAGVAWMMFGGQQGDMRVLDRGAGVRPDRPAEARQEPGSTPMSARPDAAPQRSRDDKTRAIGLPLAKQAAKPAGGARHEAMAPAPVTDALSAPPSAAVAEPGKPQGTPVPAPALASTAPVVEERAVAPVSGDAPKPASGSGSAWGNMKSLLRGSPPATTQGESQAKAPALALPVTSSEKEKDGAVLERQSARRLGFATSGLALTARPIAPPCGVVRDTRGTPLRGVQFVLLGARARMTRSGPDGVFCLEEPVVGDTLVVMHVGFEPMRLVLVSSAALALALEPIGTLGPHDGMALGRAGASSSLRPEKSNPSMAPSSMAPSPDVYEREPAALRELVAAAREAAAMAARDRTPEAWERAAGRWDAIGAATTGAPSFDARFRSLSALREALVLAPDSARSVRFKAAAAAFVAGTPRTLPERATVQGWNTELRRNSTYR